MARREVVDCDRCGAKSVVASVQVHVPVGTQEDPAEGRTEVRTEPVDLCVTCAERLLAGMVGDWSVQAGRAWLSRVRS